MASAVKKKPTLQTSESKKSVRLSYRFIIISSFSKTDPGTGYPEQRYKNPSKTKL
jgi:hypothetical protein